MQLQQSDFQLITDVGKIGEENTRNGSSAAKLSLIVGLVFLIANNFFFAANRTEFYSIDAPYFFTLTSLLLLLTGSAAIAFSGYAYLKVEQKKPPTVDHNSKRIQWSLSRIVSDVFFKERTVVLIGAVLYAVLFAFLDGILVFQPGVNFPNSYGISNTSFLVTKCCGPTGYVPVLSLFFPAQNFGVQLIPFSGLIMLLVSTLVGINVALLYVAAKQTRSQVPSSGNAKGLLGSAAAAIFGLFSGCPTCAAAFFLSTLAGSGATIASVILSQYQPLFVVLTVPLLLASMLWQAKSIRRLRASCAV